MHDYFRSFGHATGTHEQMEHLHHLGHLILTNLERMENALMAIQDDINQITDKLNTVATDLSNEIESLKAANPQVDLSGLQSVAARLQSLDVASAVQAPVEATTTTTTVEDVTTTTTTTTDAPVSSAPVGDAPAAPAAPAVDPAQGESPAPVADSAAPAQATGPAPFDNAAPAESDAPAAG